MSEFRYQPHNWLIHKLMWEELSVLVPRFASGTLLDVGCGERPYQSLTSGHIDRYVGIDYPSGNAGRSRADVHGDAMALPVADASSIRCCVRRCSSTCRNRSARSTRSTACCVPGGTSY